MVRRSVIALALSAVISAATLPSVAAADAWWTPVAFRGHAVSAVVVNSGLHVVVDGVAQASDDDGTTWRAAAAVGLPESRWAIVAGRPQLRDAHLPDASAPTAIIAITSPAALPDAAVALGSDSVVWRRGGDGDWSRALLLLPDHLGVASPRVTAVASFQFQPISTAIYVGTDGYGVLASTNGGDDWIRFDPGLPAHVSAVATDDTTGTVYAATNDGLWAHRVQAQPTFPAYHDADYWWRVAGMFVVSAAAAAAALVGMRRRAPKLPIALT